MKSSTKRLLSNIFSIEGLKLIILFFISTIIYNYLITYIKVLLGVEALEGSINFGFAKLRKTYFTGMLISCLVSMIYYMIPFTTFLNSIFNRYNVKTMNFSSFLF